MTKDTNANERGLGQPGSDTAEQEMVRLIASQARSAPVPVLIALSTLALIAAGRIPVWLAVLWLALAIGNVVWRFAALRKLPGRADLRSSERLQTVVWLNLLSGIIHASALWVFPALSEPERAFFSVLLLGLCSGSVGTSAGYRPALLAYAAPVMACLALLWAVSPGIAQPSLVERVIALLMLFYGAVLLGLARELNRAIIEAWTIRLRERDLNQQLSQALAVAEQASRAKTRFLAAASHDLRQPLHTITMLGAALALRAQDPRSKQIIALLNEVSQSFSAQLDGLLDISKLDAGVIQVERKAVRVADLVAQHMAEIEGLLQAKTLSPVLHIETHTAADTDPQLLLRILRNLTHNAIKFTDHGSIALEVRQAGDAIEIVVADTGRGIPEDQQDKVFQEFYQVGNAERDRTQGLGLGLSIVRRLVDMLDIGLHMRSIPGQGTRFVLRLPLAASASAVPATALDAPNSSFFGLTVLLVDDEKSVRTGLRVLLEELGCTCIEAASTAQAIQQIQQRRPDLLLADFRLRGSDSGLATIAAVQERWPGVMAVLVSGDTAPDRLLEAQRAGIRLLHKPLPMAALQQELATVQQAMLAQQMLSQASPL